MLLGRSKVKGIFIDQSQARPDAPIEAENVSAFKKQNKLIRALAKVNCDSDYRNTALQLAD